MSDIYAVRGENAILISDLLESIDSDKPMCLRAVLIAQKIIDLTLDEEGKAAATTHETRFSIESDLVDIEFMTSKEDFQPEREVIKDPDNNISRIITMYRAVGRSTLKNYPNSRSRKAFLQIPNGSDDLSTLEIFTPVEQFKEY